MFRVITFRLDICPLTEVIGAADLPFAVTISGTVLRFNVAQVDRAMATTAHTMRIVTGLMLRFSFIFTGMRLF